MISAEKRRLFVERADMLLKNMRCCNSACDVHEVGNIRNTAVCLKHMIEDGGSPFTEQDFERLLKNAEARCVRFFQKKYGYST